MVLYADLSTRYLNAVKTLKEAQGRYNRSQRKMCSDPRFKASQKFFLANMDRRYVSKPQWLQDMQDNIKNLQETANTASSRASELKTVFHKNENQSYEGAYG